MAETIILETAKTFILKMTDEDLEQLAAIVNNKKSNFFDVVLACFHCGLVTLTTHGKCYQANMKTRKKGKNILPKSTHNQYGI